MIFEFVCCKMSLWMTKAVCVVDTKTKNEQGKFKCIILLSHCEAGAKEVCISSMNGVWSC